MFTWSMIRRAIERVPQCGAQPAVGRMIVEPPMPDHRECQSGSRKRQRPCDQRRMRRKILCDAARHNSHGVRAGQDGSERMQGHFRRNQP